MSNKFFAVIKKSRAMKIASFLLLFISGLVGLDAHADSSPKQEYLVDIQKIINRGKLIVALPNLENTKLFAHNEAGELQGYYIDVAKKIAQQLGVKVEFNQSSNSFDDVVNLVAQKKADIAICHLSKTLERAKKILYANTNTTLHRTLLISRTWLAKDNPLDTDNTDPVQVIHNNKAVIGTIKGSSYVEYTKENFPTATIKEYSIESLFPALVKGEINAIFYDEIYIKELIKLQPGINFKFRLVELKSNPDFIAMAVPPGEWSLLYWLNFYIEINNLKINADELLREMYSKY